VDRECLRELVPCASPARAAAGMLSWSMYKCSIKTELTTNESLEYLSRIQIMKVVQILSPISNLIFVVAVGLVEHVEHSAQFLSVSPHTQSFAQSCCRFRTARRRRLIVYWRKKERKLWAQRTKHTHISRCCCCKKEPTKEKW
jgi:hypothetical protein